MGINANMLENLGRAVEIAVVKSANVPGNQSPDRQSGYLTVLDRASGQVLLIQAIGDIPPAKIEKYRKFSMEKAERLLANPKHISSWQSRIKGDEKYGGAIAVKGLIISFSGLKEYADESVCIWAAKKAKLFTRKDGKYIQDITDISESSWFLEGLEAV